MGQTSSSGNRGGGTHYQCALNYVKILSEMKECCLAFQNIDVRESISTSNTSEIHLFGATKVGLIVLLVRKYRSYRHQSGHSILVKVVDFEHYFYYPAPRGLSADDIDPIRDYLNVGRAALPMFCPAQIKISTHLECIANGKVNRFLH